MDYKKLIEETTNKLNDYSFDDELYSGIYAKAKERLDSAYVEGIRAVNDTYKAERRKAIGDNALETKSLQQELASKGLALSGESAMLSLNQSMALRNTVADIARAAIQSKHELVSGYNKNLTELEKEQADRKIDVITKDKEALGDRLAHLEKLQADKEKWQADYALELLKEENRVNEAALSKDNTEGINGGFPVFKPGTTPSQMADKIMASCGLVKKKYEDEVVIYSAFANDKIRKAVVQEACIMGLDPEYLKNVIYVLMGHGFDGDIDLDIACGKPLKWIYGAYDTAYDEEYHRLLEKGFTQNDAGQDAKRYAKKKMYAFMDTLNLSDYEKEKINDYLWIDP